MKIDKSQEYIAQVRVGTVRTGYYKVRGFLLKQVGTKFKVVQSRVRTFSNETAANIAAEAMRAGFKREIARMKKG